MFSVMSARLIDKAWDLKKPLADRRPVGNFDSMDGEHPVAAFLSSVYGLSPSRAMHTPLQRCRFFYPARLRFFRQIHALNAAPETTRIHSTSFVPESLAIQ